MNKENNLELFKQLVSKHDFEFELYEGERYNRGVRSLIKIQNLMSSLIRQDINNKEICLKIWNDMVLEKQELSIKKFLLLS